MKNKGITLIALIITVIVLLILAGVTINLTIGENGIFKTAKLAAKNYTNAQEKELVAIAKFNNTLNDTINGLGKSDETLKDNIDLTPAYSGNGYLFIYDGSLGQSGSEGANVCKDTTGGWEASAIDWRTDFDYWNFKKPTITYENNYIKFCISGNLTSGSAYTVNTINFSEYDEAIIKMDLYKEAQTMAYPGFCNDKTIKDTLGGHTLFSPCSWAWADSGTYSGWHSVKLNNISYEINYAMIGLYVDVDGNLALEPYCNIYEYALLKEDNWRDWLKSANIDSESYSSLEEVINNSTVMYNLMHNDKAIKYMLKCSGTLMTEIIKNDNAWQYITADTKSLIQKNKNWNKFTEIYGRTLN